MLNDKRLRFIVGHYASGKTEFSINYAIKLVEMGKKVALVDLDVVNLYFRSREKKEFLEKLGIKVIASSVNASAVDIPAISAEVFTPMQDTSYEAVIDVGGDPDGARALGRYKDYIVEGDYDMFYVLNANRPETQTAEKAVEYLRKIEDTARARVTGLINNTHMLKSTTVEDVLKGQEVALEVSKMTNIPIKYISVIEKIAKDLPDNLEGEVFPITLYMREDWMI
ncbi:ATP-binding protein [Keratinibaculum paraultunense]|uniref:nucleotide-binding protein n=1 Tax=Keratinibaculum paraultunense TaxID=1278232 RepID=UPI00104CCDBE|nr:ATP-binding protein [Keratinibaculum paraultunense]QQY79342.1 ATP-binding protein [Keratinibaculum paraultunense]